MDDFEKRIGGHVWLGSICILDLMEFGISSPHGPAVHLYGLERLTCLRV